VWGDHKPSKQIADVWFYVQPFLFGTIGAALLFSQLRSEDVGKSFVCIIVGQVMRFIGSFLSSSGGKYTIRERIFISLSWIPKSTVPATLASVIYTESKAMGAQYSELTTFGLNIQTTTILAIIVCEPIGSFLID
jgi:NhaP-type Na+/H+ or K+/H+ antiporter